MLPSMTLTMLHCDDTYARLPRRLRAPLNLLFLTLHLGCSKSSLYIYWMTQKMKTKEEKTKRISAFKLLSYALKIYFFSIVLCKWIWFKKLIFLQKWSNITITFYLLLSPFKQCNMYLFSKTNCIFVLRTTMCKRSIWVGITYTILGLVANHMETTELLHWKENTSFNY